MKKLIAVAALVLALTGCTASTETKMVVIQKELKDKRIVECVAAFGNASAVDCDWENAK